MSKKIYKFDKELLGMNLKPSYETTVNNKKVIYRLVEGESDLNIKNQSETADPIYYKINTIKQVEDDETVQEWLENHPRFGSLITEFNPVKEKETELATIEEELDIIDEVRNLKDEDALSLGYVLFGRDVLSRNPKVLKHDLIKAAMTDATEVKTKMDAKQNAEELFVGLALATQVIKESDAGTVVRWADNDAKITSVTKGVTPVQELVNYFKTTEGATVKQEIHLRVRDKFAEKVVETKKATPKAKTTEAKAVETKDQPQTEADKK